MCIERNDNLVRKGTHPFEKKFGQSQTKCFSTLRGR